MKFLISSRRSGEMVFGFTAGCGVLCAKGSFVVDGLTTGMGTLYGEVVTVGMTIGVTAVESVERKPAESDCRVAGGLLPGRRQVGFCKFLLERLERREDDPGGDQDEDDQMKQQGAKK